MISYQQLYWKNRAAMKWGVLALVGLSPNILLMAPRKLLPSLGVTGFLVSSVYSSAFLHSPFWFHFPQFTFPVSLSSSTGGNPSSLFSLELQDCLTGGSLLASSCSASILSLFAALGGRPRFRGGPS